MTSDNATSGINSTINVTPMIDVLLVLLIIFMVITPAIPKGESAQVPHPSRSNARVDPASVVLEVLKAHDGGVSFRLNQRMIAPQDLAMRLTEIYANRAEKVLFLKGDDQLSFTQIANVIDTGHAVGVERIALLTPHAQAGL
jgi:biopolymer transport protein TolR